MREQSSKAVADIEKAFGAALEWKDEVLADWLAAARTMVAGKAGEFDTWGNGLTMYGCWCGPGNRCTDDKDQMDGCRHKHDEAYDALGLAADTMWSPAAFVAPRKADADLVECIKGSVAGPGSEPDFEAYRAALIKLFEARLEVAKNLADLADLVGRS